MNITTQEKATEFAKAYANSMHWQTRRAAEGIVTRDEAGDAIRRRGLEIGSLAEKAGMLDEFCDIFEELWVTHTTKCSTCGGND